MTVSLQPPERRIDRAVRNVRQADAVDALDELVAVRLALADEMQEDEAEDTLEDLAVVRGRLQTAILTQVPVYAK